MAFNLNKCHDAETQRSENESFPLNFLQNAVLAIPPFYICLTAWTYMALSQPHEFQEIG